MGEKRIESRIVLLQVIGFIVALLLGTSGVSIGATDTPFSPPTFSFTLSASRGAVPLTVIAQPMVSGETGDFEWDWDGDGKVDEISHYKTQHPYTETGDFYVNAWLQADSGMHYEADKKVHLVVTDSFTGPSGTGTDTNNHDWSTAELLPLDNTVYRHLGAGSYHFYTIKVYEAGNYLIKTWALNSESQNAGAVVTLYSSIGFIKVRSGATTGGKFGYMAVKLDKGSYTIEVINTSSAIDYGLSFTKDNGEVPSGGSSGGSDGGDSGGSGGTTGIHTNATPISCGATKTATLSTEGQWYEFSISSDAQITITTAKGTNSFASGAKVSLYDASDSEIASDGGSTTFGTISHSLLAGTYYILVKAVEGSTIGSYTLTLTCESGGGTSGGTGDNSTLSLPSKPTVEEVLLPDTGPSPVYPLALHTEEGMYTLLLGTGKYESPVDVYVVAILPSGASWIFKRYTNEAGLTTSLQPYVANSTEPTDGTSDVLTKIPSSIFPSGTTTFYLLIVKAGTDLSTIDWEHDPYLLQYFSVKR